MNISHSGFIDPELTITDLKHFHRQGPATFTKSPHKTKDTRQKMCILSEH